MMFMVGAGPPPAVVTAKGENRSKAVFGIIFGTSFGRNTSLRAGLNYSAANQHDASCPHARKHRARAKFWLASLGDATKRILFLVGRQLDAITEPSACFWDVE